MRNGALKSVVSFFLVLGICSLYFLGIAYADSYRSPISIKINLKKAVFELYEPIEGEVILNNPRAVSLPAVFEVKLYRQGHLEYQGLLEIKTVFTGTTRLPLKNVGIPNINDHPGAAGRWHLAILQQNTDPLKTARASFSIMAPRDNGSAKTNKDK